MCERERGGRRLYERVRELRRKRERNMECEGKIGGWREEGRGERVVRVGLRVLMCERPSIPSGLTIKPSD